jgi:hypothetical protein
MVTWLDNLKLYITYLMRTKVRGRVSEEPSAKPHCTHKIRKTDPVLGCPLYTLHPALYTVVPTPLYA